MTSRLIPELEVEDLDRSLVFYTGIIGFTVHYARPEERFAFLELEGVNLMLEEAAGPGRRLHIAALSRSRTSMISTRACSRRSRL
jgi:catechol 2,3-dioxygenase-like lactoylglutathione lyase family enzyme